MSARALIALSSAAFLHAAYGAWQARTAARHLGVRFDPSLFGSHLPLPITLQALVSFALLILGVLLSAPQPKGVSFASEMATRSIDTADSGIAFANLRHRGRILFGPGPGSSTSPNLVKSMAKPW